MSTQSFPVKSKLFFQGTSSGVGNAGGDMNARGRPGVIVQSTLWRPEPSGHGVCAKPGERAPGSDAGVVCRHWTCFYGSCMSFLTCLKVLTQKQQEILASEYGYSPGWPANRPKLYGYILS